MEAKVHVFAKSFSRIDSQAFCYLLLSLDPCKYSSNRSLTHSAESTLQQLAHCGLFNASGPNLTRNSRYSSKCFSMRFFDLIVQPRLQGRSDPRKKSYAALDTTHLRSYGDWQSQTKIARHSAQPIVMLRSISQRRP